MHSDKEIDEIFERLKIEVTKSESAKAKEIKFDESDREFFREWARKFFNHAEVYYSSIENIWIKKP